jgi:type VI secretion system protein ImpB
MAGSFQNEIPAARINLKLDVGKGGAKKKTELPLKLLALGDFSRKPKKGRVAERERIAVNRNNFAQVMESMGLQLSCQVPNRLSGEGDIDVSFGVKSIESFRPESVARAVPALGRLLAARNLLKDLKSNLLDNREFRKRLEEIIRDDGAVKSLHGELRKLIAQEPVQAS